MRAFGIENVMFAKRANIFGSGIVLWINRRLLHVRRIEYVRRDQVAIALRTARILCSLGCTIVTIRTDEFDTSLRAISNFRSVIRDRLGLRIFLRFMVERAIRLDWRVGK